MNAHLSQDELLDQIYGVGGEDSHLRECAECSGRLKAMELRRSEVTTAPEASNEFLASQRRAIYARMDKAASAQWRWVPALGVACLLAVGVFLSQPRPHYRPVNPPATAARVDSVNEQLFSDLYSMEQSVEPRAAAPIHALFEQVSDPEEQ